MKKYQRLTCIEREDISRMIAAGASLTRIAIHINRATSTITREIHRTVVIRTCYRACYAHCRAVKKRHKVRKRKLSSNSKLRKVVLWHLARKWSPE